LVIPVPGTENLNTAKSEGGSTIRWGLNGVGVWPRVEMLLSTGDQEVLAEAKGNVVFFVNAALLSVAAGLTLVVDRVVEHSPVFPHDLLYLVPFVVASICYRASVGAAIRWGTVVGASIDLHRREVYERVGMRMPLTFSEERERIGPALSGAILRGELIRDDLYQQGPRAG
jgi:hypothetical protein